MGVLELLLPPACAGCSRFGVILCDACLGSLRPAGGASDPFIGADPGLVVGEAFEIARAAFVHEGSLRRALQRLKYGGAARLAAPLAAAALPALGEMLDMLGGETVLVPVPLHPERLRQRGYNQAALLAVELGAGRGLPVLEALVRRRPTARQHGLGKAARLRNLRGAFGPGAPLPPGSIPVLVDDILTTAATLEACAEVLRDGGSGRVAGLAVAREV